MNRINGVKQRDSNQILFTSQLNQKRIWCSGIIVPSHGTDQGSIPWMRNFFFLSFRRYSV
ncbi:hypothetical protein N665_0008s0225 [Sinapis alba]|nr:hypothetical protein N665_0008s0225 [Sinapis alba]